MPRKPKTYDRIQTVRFREKDVKRIAIESRKAKLTPGEWIREQIQRIIGTFTQPENGNGERTRE